MRNLIILLLLSFSFMHSQVPDARYMKLDAYKSVYKVALTKEDTLNFQIHDQDTLVLVTPQVASRIKVWHFEYRDENFLNVYRKIAFNSRYKSSDGNNYLVYWKKPIKIYLTDKFSTGLKRDFKKFVKEVTGGIDSLRISFTTNMADANMIIYSEADPELEPYMASAKADFQNYWNKSQFSKSFIKLDRTAYFNDMLLRERLFKLFVLSLGNFASTDLVDCDNLFSSCDSHLKRLTKFDKEIIRYHYSYGICKGISQSTFDDLHETALEHRRKHPDIPYHIAHYSPPTQ